MCMYVRLCVICKVKITKSSFLLEEVMASAKPKELLRIRSIFSVPALGAFLVRDRASTRGCADKRENL